MPKRSSRDPLVEEFLRFLEVERNASSRTVLAYHQAYVAFRRADKSRVEKMHRR